MKYINATLTDKVRLAIEALAAEGRLQAPLEQRLIWPTASPEVRKRLESNLRARLVHDVVNPLFKDETGPMVLELFRQHAFEIEVYAHARKKSRVFKKYVLTARGPVRRLYVLEGESRSPKRRQAPARECLVSLRLLLVQADSAMDFQAKLYYFLGQATNHVLQPTPRKKSTAAA